MPRLPDVKYPEQTSALQQILVVVVGLGAAYLATRDDAGWVGGVGLIVVFVLMWFRPSGMWRSR